MDVSCSFSPRVHLPQDWLREKLKASEELLKERDCVGHLIPGSVAAVCRINDTGNTILPGDSLTYLLLFGRFAAASAAPLCTSGKHIIIAVECGPKTEFASTRN